MKVTVPVAVEGDKVTRRVRDCPDVDGLTDELSVVVVVA